MKVNYIYFLILILLQQSFIFTADLETFTAEKMHLLHRLSSFVASPDGKYIVYANRLWDKETGKYYNNLEYIKLAEYEKKLKDQEQESKTELETLTLEFNEEYPTKPPTVKFNTSIFHPNVYSDGKICLDILSNQWSSIFDVHVVLESIQSLLADPNPNSPANAEAARLYVENKKEYKKRVLECVENSWKQ